MSEEDRITGNPECKELDGISSESVVLPNSSKPTSEAYSALLKAHQFFNKELFNGELSEPLLALARKPRAIGWFSPRRYESKSGEQAHEIVMNPHFLRRFSDYDSLSTLVHEMVHQWREELGPLNRRGTKGSRGYHDVVWADYMERVGLMPSTTGEPGGKRTGPRVSHYIIEGGPFDVAVRALLDSGFSIRWSDRLRDPVMLEKHRGVAEKVKKDRIRFTCRACGLNAWAKPGAALKCAPCDLLMPPQPTD